jgi:hypothetical protein
MAEAVSLRRRFYTCRLEFDTLDDLAAGRCPALDVICNGILDGGTPFIFDSAPPMISVSDRAESGLRKPSRVTV